MLEKGLLRHVLGGRLITTEAPGQIDQPVLPAPDDVPECAGIPAMTRAAAAAS